MGATRAHRRVCHSFCLASHLPNSLLDVLCLLLLHLHLCSRQRCIFALCSNTEHNTHIKGNNNIQVHNSHFLSEYYNSGSYLSFRSANVARCLYSVYGISVLINSYAILSLCHKYDFSIYVRLLSVSKQETENQPDTPDTSSSHCRRRRRRRVYVVQNYNRTLWDSTYIYCKMSWTAEEAIKGNESDDCTISQRYGKKESDNKRNKKLKFEKKKKKAPSIPHLCEHGIWMGNCIKYLHQFFSFFWRVYELRSLSVVWVYVCVWYINWNNIVISFVQLTYTRCVMFFLFISFWNCDMEIQSKENAMQKLHSVRIEREKRPTGWVKLWRYLNIYSMRDVCVDGEKKELRVYCMMCTLLTVSKK